MRSERSVSDSRTPRKPLLVDEGFDPIYGARPLRRTIQRRVLDPLAMRMLQGKFVEGDHVVVDVSDGEIAFRKEEPITA